MNIILQNYKDLIKKVIFDNFSNNLKEELNKIDGNNVMNYISLLSNLDESLCNIARESLVTIFESIDKSFSISNERKRKYYIKSHHSRTILTVFGEITFTRTFYQSKLNNKLYCHVDRLLGLHKYDYFDPYLKASIVHYASNNSYPQTAIFINDLIGNRIKIDKSFKYVSRQTVRNILKSANLSNVKHDVKNTPDTLYIIADEKWIHTQNNNKKDVMEKSIVLFESIEDHKLKNKMTFASLDNSFLINCLDYIYDSYDIDKIKTIYVMGDGASWIKNLRHEFKFNKDINVVFGLDKFHTLQALRHILNEDDVAKALLDYILTNNKEDFNRLINEIIDLYPHRIDTINEKRSYILNNWIYINNLYYHKLSCPMESQISHTLADFFTSRPKAYSIYMINKLTKLRLLFKNNFNIKKLYLNNFNSKQTLTIDSETLNFDLSINYDIPSVNKLIPYYSCPFPFDNSYLAMRHF